MKPINLLEEFELKTIYLYLDEDYKRKLLDNAIRKSGSQSLLAKDLQPRIKNKKIMQSVIANWFLQKNLRLDELNGICTHLGAEVDKSKIKGIKGETTTQLIKNPNLEIPLTRELSALLANFYCDGCIEYKNGFISQYTNQSKELLRKFKFNFRKTFGEVNFPSNTSGPNKITTLRIPCFIGKFLFYKFDIYNNYIPKEIKNAPKEIKSAYVRAVFDDEGSIHKDHGQIRLKMKHRSYIKDVKSILENEFGIKCSKVKKEIRFKFSSYYFHISGITNLRKYYEEIGFTHLRKYSRLKNKVEKGMETYGYQAKEVVYSALKEHGPKTTKELAPILKRDRRTINHHLVNLKKQNRVKFEKSKLKFVYEYLWMIKR